MTQVRVRFAPSPTGAPHIGNLRTALFNWLWARHNQGKFILRVEDTDQTREVENGLELIMDSLRFLGLDWDEGPDIGGPYGPYRQSERLALYQKYAEELVQRGAAYYCYCTPEELEQMRQAQQARGEATRYDRRCRWLTPQERAARERAGKPRVIRLAVPLEGSTTLHDFIHGDITIANASVDDQVLLKSDGFPTYHLAVVVDDHLMAITHVMRADEWISSFPKHILLYQAFGWEPPQFGHLPIVLGPDKRKLSKRHGATSVDELRAQGYLPEALVNLMALLGWSYDDRTELFTREQLIGLFTLERIHASPAIFDRTKLDWMNGHYIRKLESADLAERLMPFLTRAGVPADRETVQQLVPLVRERLKRLDEIVPLVDFFFKDELAYEPAQLIGPKMTAAASLQALRAAEESLRRLADFEEAAIEQALRSTGAQLGLTAAQFFGLVRVAVTGKTVTPPLIGTLRILGRDKTLARLRQAITTLERMAMEAERVG
ncbi:MAG: glutamate--tRNA ligase [candidate division KSB1 bacterium]|nr:glutamate--tRNA ligase [candidate division KSB1 bacterium]